MYAEKSAAHRLMVNTPDEMYDSNLNVNVNMMFGFTNYVRYSILPFSNLALSMFQRLLMHVRHVVAVFTTFFISLPFHMQFTRYDL